VVKTKGTKEWATRNVNFSEGCSNGCLYCYARKMAHRFGRRSWNDWPNMNNKSEMANRRFQKRDGWIMSPSSHDITWQNVKLAINVFYNILKAHNNLLIVTKPDPLVIKKLCEELLFAYREQVLFRFTISSLDDRILSYWEPGAPSAQKRLAALRYAFMNNYNTSVSIEPFLDENVVELVKTLLPWVTDTIWIGPMNKVHVPKKLWTEKEEELYSPQSLLKIKEQVDSLGSEKIRYKDHFLNKLQENNSYRKKKYSNSVRKLTDFFWEVEF